jgi:hypothetical protein
MGQPGGQRVHRRLDDAGGLDTTGRRGLPEVRAREVGVAGDGGGEADVRDPAVGPLGPEEGLQLDLGATG